MPKHNHTPEPWKHIWKHDTHKVKRDAKGCMLGTVTMGLDDYGRAIDCVNAMTGIENPSMVISELMEALRDLHIQCRRYAPTLDRSRSRAILTKLAALQPPNFELEMVNG